MAEITVKELAELIKIDKKILLEKFRQSGVFKNKFDDIVSDIEKNKLLSFIKGITSKNKKPFILQGKTIKQIKLSDNRKINIEVRKKKSVMSYVNQDLKQVVSKDNNLKDNNLKDNNVKEKEKNDKILQPINTIDKKYINAIKKVVKHKKSLDKANIKLESKKSDNFKIISVPPVVKSKNSLVSNKKHLNKPKNVNKTKVGTFDKDKDKDKDKDNYIKRDKNIKRLTNKKGKNKDYNIEEDFNNATHKVYNSSKNSFKIKNFKVQKFNKPVNSTIKTINIINGITINNISQKLSIKIDKILKVIKELDIKDINKNKLIDNKTAHLLINELGHKANIVENDFIINKDFSDKNTGYINRSPAVVIMGHVDHGKTTLLDYIRKTQVAKTEDGNITQSIGSYSVKTSAGNIIFLDTPGHEAFFAMRSRSIKITDIVILVVSIDDGVMPQTIEAINHAQQSKVPIIVAINKIDKTNNLSVDIEKIKNSLSQYNVVSEDWGGDSIFCLVSALTGSGIKDLLNAINLQAEILELKSYKQKYVEGFVIESTIKNGYGPIASVLIKHGSLSKGDIVLCDDKYGKVKLIFDNFGNRMEKAASDMPINILGIPELVKAGDKIISVKDEKVAKEISEIRKRKKLDSYIDKNYTFNVDNLFDNENKDKDKVNIILKANSQGAIDAISASLLKIINEKIQINIISSGIGGINLSDTTLSLTSSSIILGFNVRADNTAKEYSVKNKIDIKYYKVIYDLISDFKKLIFDLTPLKERELIIGVAEVKNIFKSLKFPFVAGCLVISGIVKKNNPIRVLRDNIVIYEGHLESLKHLKKDMTEVKNGMECGIGVKNYTDIKIKDQIEVFEIKLDKEKYEK